MFEIIKSGTRIDFLGKSRQFFMLSGFLLLLSIGSMVFRTVNNGSPLNYGIDFTGGTEIQLSFKQDIPPDQVRKTMNDLGYPAEVQSIDTGGQTFDYLVRIREQVNLIDAAKAETLKQAFDARKEQVGGVARIELASSGDRLYFKFEREPNQEELKKVFTEAGIQVTQVEQTGRPQDLTYTVHTEELQKKIGDRFLAELGTDKFSEVARVQVVGPKAGAQLRNDGIKAVLVSLLLIVLYIAIRFDFRYSVGALLSLIHDPIIILGFFSIFWWEFSLTGIAALLTIVGYSINDTIIVFDRIRESFSFSRDKDLVKTANTAINETLSRTILTSGTTLLTVAALFVFGGSLLQEFSVALMIGVIVGTYSSIGVASSVMVVMDRWLPQLQSMIGAGKSQQSSAPGSAVKNS